MQPIDSNTWRKSTYSGTSGGNCVEVGQDGAVLVRDTKDHAGRTLAFSAEAWRAYTAGLKTPRQHRHNVL